MGHKNAHQLVGFCETQRRRLNKTALKRNFGNNLTILLTDKHRYTDLVSLEAESPPVTS